VDPPVIRRTKVVLNPFDDLKINLKKQEPVQKIDQKAALLEQKAKDK
jgi:hypothetical protein